MKKIKKVLNLTYYHMRSRYRKTLAGFIWVILNPIINFSAQALVFKTILKINIENYPMFLLAGLLPWFFISQSITNLAGSLVASRELLLGFKLNPLIIISCQILDNFFNYLVATLVIGITLFLMGYIVLTPLQVGLFFLDSLMILPFVFFTSALVSFLHVFYRDVQFVATFLMNLAFFLTPIFYTIDYVEEKYQWIFNLNIFYPMINLFQVSLHSFSVELWLKSFMTCFLIVIALGLLLHFLMKKKIKDFYINV